MLAKSSQDTAISMQGWLIVVTHIVSLLTALGTLFYVIFLGYQKRRAFARAAQALSVKKQQLIDCINRAHYRRQQRLLQQYGTVLEPESDLEAALTRRHIVDGDEAEAHFAEIEFLDSVIDVVSRPESKDHVQREYCSTKPLNRPLIRKNHFLRHEGGRQIYDDGIDPRTLNAIERVVDVDIPSTSRARPVYENTVYSLDDEA
jgi:hypothetical protein